MLNKQIIFSLFLFSFLLCFCNATSSNLKKTKSDQEIEQLYGDENWSEESSNNFDELDEDIDFDSQIEEYILNNYEEKISLYDKVKIFIKLMELKAKNNFDKHKKKYICFLAAASVFFTAYLIYRNRKTEDKKD